jgi:hypothetical protein
MNERENILKQFLSDATPEEIDELKKLLDEKKKSPVPGAADFHKIAGKVAKQIHNQMGLTNTNLMQTAKDLVINIALHHNPDLTEQELNVIANNMVPERKVVKLPADLLHIMIEQFVSYGKGCMSAIELNDLPEGWAQKYWNAFPDIIQKLISAYIRDEITEDEFHKAVKYNL